jgi:hypothetical protein
VSFSEILHACLPPLETVVYEIHIAFAFDQEVEHLGRKAVDPWYEQPCSSTDSNGISFGHFFLNPSSRRSTAA